MRKLIIPLFFCCLLSACQSDDDMPQITPNPDPPLTFLALGDSYTIGESVDVSERWPAQLVNRLEADGVRIATPTIVARTGWTTSELQTGITAASLAPPYDMVSLLIGVNNQFRGLSLEEYATEFRQLLNQSIQFAGNDPARTFVVSIPDYAYTPFGNGNPATSTDIDTFNTTAADISTELGVVFVNITPISRDGLADPTLVAGDNLHPSGKQYARWVDEKILAAVQELLDQ
ncbi:MAG: SGNH/GDSL hydrolase family protein [Saprospiraceae bacterium]